MQETQERRVQSLGGEDPLEKEMALHSSILLGKLHEQRSLVGYSPWGCKHMSQTQTQSQTQLSDWAHTYKLINKSKSIVKEQQL